MFSFDFFWFVDSALIFLLAFLIDVIFGEYPDRIHPTIGIGKIISYLKPKLKNPNPKIEKANGVILALTVMLIFAIPVFLLLFWIRQSFGLYGQIAYIIAGAVLFKATFAVKGMGSTLNPSRQRLKKTIWLKHGNGSPILSVETQTRLMRSKSPPPPWNPSRRAPPTA